jgi:hypothetical protein
MDPTDPDPQRCYVVCRYLYPLMVVGAEPQEGGVCGAPGADENPAGQDLRGPGGGGARAGGRRGTVQQAPAPDPGPTGPGVPGLSR